MPISISKRSELINLLGSQPLVLTNLTFSLSLKGGRRILIVLLILLSKFIV